MNDLTLTDIDRAAEGAAIIAEYAMLGVSVCFNIPYSPAEYVTEQFKVSARSWASFAQAVSTQ